MVPPERATPDVEPDESNLSRSYAAVIAIEVLVVIALYWLGRHFG